MRQIIRFLLNLALFFLRALLVLKSFFVGLFKLIAKPSSVVLRFFYYILILPLYRLYLLAGKKLGLSKSKQDKWLSTILINKKLVHFLFIGLIGLMVYFNVFQVRHNLSSEEVVGKTMLYKIVANETTQADQLIEEYQQPPMAMKRSQDDYWIRGAVMRAPLAIDYSQDNYSLAEEQPAQSGPAQTRQAPARTDIIEYTIKPGDSIGTIAAYFGISMNTILWENGLTVKSYIKPGDKLRILPVSGVTYAVAKGDTLAAIAKKYSIDPSDILSYNNLSNANQIRKGEKLILPGAKNIAGRTVAGPISPAQRQQPRTLVDLITGGGSATARTGGKLNWPTHGTITQYYSWAHTGVDIANHIGTPIYAAESGTVTTAGWNSGGYGYQIVIDHGNGLQTRYAHLSQFAVSVGDDVERGQNIAFMGSTGHSTGPHLHFEVMIYGKHYNPLGYLY